jgi:hypothetical protein
MKAISIIGIILILACGILYISTHEVVYVTVYPKKVTAIESIFLSKEGNALIQTKDGYLIVSLIPQFKNYPFGVDSKAETKASAPLPNWSEMKLGEPPKDLLATFEEVPIIRDGIESTKFVDSHDMSKVDALVVFENEYWAYGQAFACIHFRLYSNRSVFPEQEPKIFTIELLSKLEWHYVTKHINI